MRILIAEDDINILNGLVQICSDEGYETFAARDGNQAWEIYQQQRPDFACLDIMMPGMDGYEVCRRIRQSGADTPVIFISAKSEEIDKVLGLELGADDYITKPFGVREVTARIRAVTRRCLAAQKKNDAPTTFIMNDLTISPDELRARRGEEIIDLSLRDIAILRVLYEHRNKVVDRNTLFRKVWDLDHIAHSRTLDQHISQLRKRIEHDPKNPAIIATVHGLGYRYEEVP